MKTTGTSHLASVNRGFLLFLGLHVPALCGVAAWFGSSIGLTAVLGALFVAGPGILYLLNPESKLASASLGASALCFSALLIHLSGGMIEMHFHVFTMLAALILFQFPWPVLVGAAVIAVHHVAFFIWLPASVFSYKASFGIVLLHAFFVVLETIPAVWLTRRLAALTAVQLMVGERLTQTVRGVSDAARQVADVSGALADAT